MTFFAKFGINQKFNAQEATGAQVLPILQAISDLG